MSMTLARDGRRLVLEKMRSLRNDEALRERDREMYRKYAEGHTYADLALIFGRTKGLVSQRFKKIPMSVKLAIRRDVAAIRRMRLETLSESRDGVACG